MRAFAMAGFGLTTLLAGCSPTTETADSEARRPVRQCFSIQQVDNFRQGRMEQVFLRVGRNEVYELNSAGGCVDLDFAYRLAIVPDTGSSSRLCTGDWAQVVVPGSTSVATTCRVRVMRRLTEAEIEALPGSHRP